MSMSSLKRYIPKPLKYPLIGVYILARCLLRGHSAQEASLNLSGVLPPVGSSKIVHGGKVKLLHLRERFGDTWNNFNIAYFVSSGLPFAPSIWIRIYKLFRVRVVWNQNGTAYPALYSSKIVRSINSLMKPIHQSDYVVYQSEFVKRCADKYLGVFRGLSSVIINPVDTNLFKPSTTPLPEDTLCIIILGNHHESKERMRISLESIRIIQERGIKVKLIIIGKMDSALNENWVEASGAYLQSDAPGLFQSAHIFLHLKYLDPCPTTVLEALACGIPVVGQANGGMPELVSNQSGILLPVVEDFDNLHYPKPLDIAEAILEIKDNLTEFSTNAREQGLKFDKDIWLAKHEVIFKSLLS